MTQRFYWNNDSEESAKIPLREEGTKANSKQNGGEIFASQKPIKIPDKVAKISLREEGTKANPKQSGGKFLLRKNPPRQTIKI